MKHETEDYIVTCEETQELKDKVFHKLLEFYKTYNCFSGEVLCQNYDPMIEAQYLLEDIADNVIKFDVQYKGY